MSSRPSRRKAPAPASNEVSASAFQSGSFSLPELVSHLSDNLLSHVSIGGPGFDPQAFISRFESTVEQLLPLRDQVAALAEEHERDASYAEKEYATRLREVRGQFETVVKSFGNLESRIAEIGRTAISIGDQLESIDRIRQRASSAHDIILYYLDFAKGDTTRLDTLRKEGGRDGRAKTATLLRKLVAVAREARDIENGEATCDAIEKYCEKFEKDMLKLFDRYYRKGDPKMMSHCAQTLLDFNGGQSCIQIYVNQHDFFISSTRLKDAAGLSEGEFGQILPDPSAPAPPTEPGLKRLFDDIRETFNQEAQIVQAVFPNPPSVMQVFLQRVFAQVVQSYIEQATETASALSSLAFLRFLRLSHQNTSRLIDDLKAHAFLKVKGASTPKSVDPFMLPAAGLETQHAPTGTIAIAHMLDTTYEELFTPYLEGSKYIDREIGSLTELYAAHLLAFASYHQAQNKGSGKTNVFDRMVQQLASTNAGSSPLLGSDTQSRLKALMKLKSSRSSEPDAGESPNPQQQREGTLEIVTASRLLEWHAEAVGRMVELVPTAEIPKSAFALLRVLADTIGRAYVEVALETASAQAKPSTDAKTVSMPDTSLLTIVSRADTIVQLWQRYVSTTLTPLTSSAVTVRREMSVYNNHVVVRIEGRINEVLQTFTDASIAWLAVLLGRQKKLDFKPKSDEQALDRGNTEACQQACEYLDRVRDAAATSLNGRAAEAFLSEMGIAFHSQLLDHFKRFPVSATGGLMLTKDLATYQDTISNFGIPAVTERFELLRQIGNVFIIGPEIIKSYLAESHLARVEPRLLRPFLVQRSDFNSYSSRFWADVLGDIAAPAAPTLSMGSRNISSVA